MAVSASFSLAAVFQCQLRTPRRKNLAQLGPKVRHSSLWHRQLCPAKVGHRAHLGTPTGKVRKGTLLKEGMAPWAKQIPPGVTVKIE